MHLSALREARAQIRSAVNGAIETIGFLVAGSTAIFQFLIGRWPEPVILGAPKPRRRTGRPNEAEIPSDQA